MRNEQTIALRPTDEDKKKVIRLVRQHHNAGLDLEKTRELGLFSRISYLVCGIHTLTATSYRLYGEVDNLFDMAGAKRHEVKKELKLIEDAFERFTKFFRNYQTLQGVQEMNSETEYFYHQFMRWCQIPEHWELGDSQHTPSETEPMVIINTDDKELKFHRTVLSEKELEEPASEYVVTRYDKSTRTQETVGDNMDKASAQMVAKRMSVDDPENYYTASQLTIRNVRIVEVTPMKVYMKGDMVGDYRKIIKSTTK